MNVTIRMLLVATLAPALALRSASQEPERGRAVARRPVDVAVEGLGASWRTAPRAARGFSGGPGGPGAAAPSQAPSGGPPFACVKTIADQATNGCLSASSTPTLGALFPYPGIDNVFVAPAFVGGGENNSASGDYATVGGGGGCLYGLASLGNSASGDHSTIGGGALNTASGPGSTIAGGISNDASQRTATIAGGAGNVASGDRAAVGGGYNNTASGTYATVAGGGGAGILATNNIASGDSAAVGGGERNTAAGHHAIVPGGRSNTALGNHSFAAGRRAKANHNGSFVWGDSQDVNKPSSGADEFNVYCRGGARFFTNATFTAGVLLAPGSSTWTMVSDRAAKENVEPVDARGVLDRVAELPIATWNYKEQDDSIRHMGPMAQDFHAAFGLGLGERTIDTIDPNGVALAAIQGLLGIVRENERHLAEKAAEIDALRAANEALRRADAELIVRIERLEALGRKPAAE